MSAGHDHTQFLRDQIGLAFAPNACGINKAIASAPAEDDRIHRISCGSWFGRNNGALRAGQLIQQRGLADVRPTNDGHLHFQIRGPAAVSFCKGKIARQSIEEIVHP